ncbi:Trp biosynthesis-associated membrane protein [Rothia sp. P5764]|uniref:Trp biosynthesis-associated membrane protein n=1 Tax=Rothia sp. P5764 TaxID=3402654 RepID=UPI003AC18B67
MSEQIQSGAKTVPAWAKPSRVMAGSMLAAGLGFACTLSTWIRAEVTTVIDTSVIDVSGADAASTVSALALVALLASVALRIAGRRLRKILSVLIAGAGLGLAVAAYSVQADPQAAAAAQVSAATGTTAAANGYELTAMPWLGLVAGLLITLSGIWAFAASSQWRSGRKYDPSTRGQGSTHSDENPDEIDTWDSLTAGDDPTNR